MRKRRGVGSISGKRSHRLFHVHFFCFGPYLVACLCDGIVLMSVPLHYTYTFRYTLLDSLGRWAQSNATDDSFLLPFCYKQELCCFFLFVIYIELQRVFHDTRDRQREIPICCIFRVQKLCMSISQNKRLDRKWVKTQKLQNS